MSARHIRGCLMLLLAAGTTMEGTPTLEDTPQPAPRVYQPTLPRTAFQVPRLARNPAITANADFSDWAEALHLPHAYGPSRPDDQGQPAVRTDLRLGWGSDGLYLLVEALDPEPSRIHRARSPRDNIANQDRLRFWIDPAGSGRTALEFEVNALGVQGDGRFTEGSGTDDAFDLIWQSACTVTARGWVAKIRIPFASVQRRPGPWGFKASRIWPRERAYVLTFPQQSLANPCNLCQSVQLLGAPISSQGSPFLIIPRIYADRAENVTEGTLGAPRHERIFGVDLRYTGASRSLEGTLHPDFATIEADVDPVRINDRWRYIYDEKRPFFLEGMDLFSEASIRQLHTRTILKPDYGLKAGGQEGWGAWSLLQARDSHGGDSLAWDGRVSTGGRPTSDLAFGTRVHVGPEDRAGKLTFVGTDRTLLGGDVTGAAGSTPGPYSRTWSLSGFQQVLPGINARATLAGSSYRLPVEGGAPESATGAYHSLQVSGTGRNLDWEVRQSSMSPDFRMDLGFQDLAGWRQREAGLVLHTQANDRWWSRFRVEVGYESKDLWDGTPLYRVPHLYGMLTTLGRTNFLVDVFSGGREWYGGQPFHVQGFGLMAVARPFAGQSFQVYVNRVQNILYSLSVPALDRMGMLNWSGQVGSWTWQYSLSARSVSERATGRTAAASRSFSFRQEQALPADLFWRVQGQWIRIDRPWDLNPGTATDRQVSFNVRVLTGWRPNPFTSVYLGYSQVRGTIPLDLDPHHEQVTDKGLFAKAAYAIRF
jgi:hypothetical protein